MSVLPHLRLWLLAIVLFPCCGPAFADDLEKYWLDDANFVLAVNVKQILLSPLFTKHYQKRIEQLLKNEAVQSVLKDTGLDPLRDIDQVIVVAGPSSYQPEGTFEGNERNHSEGPLVLIEGRFDPQKIQARFGQLAKDMPETVKVHGIGNFDVAEVTLPGQSYFLAVLDRNSAALAPTRDQIEDVLEKSTGQKKTELKDPAIAKTLKANAADQSVRVAGTREMILGGSYSGRSENGKSTWTVKHHRIKDSGIESLSGGLTIADDVKGKVTLVGRDDAAARSLADMIQQGLKQAQEEGGKEAAKRKELVPILDALKAIQVKTDGKVVRLQGQAGPGTIAAFLNERFFNGRASPSLEPEGQSP